LPRDDLKVVTPRIHFAPTRPNWAEISASALRSNYERLCEQADQCRGHLICVIKANAYGHDVVGCARVLMAAGATWFAVTSVDEGADLVRLLRQETPVAGRAFPRVLVLGGLFAREDAERAIRYGLTPVILSLQQLQWLAEAARRECSPQDKYRFHLEIDTGMARQGVRWDDAAQLDAIVEMLVGKSNIAPEALMTHYASADDPSSPQTGQQLQYFTGVIKRLYAEGIRPPMLHAGNSVTLFDASQAESLMDLAHTYGARLLLRPGLALYGYGVANADLEPVLTWKTRITGLRRVQAGAPVSYNATYHSMRAGTIATLATGYADGYNRLLSNRGTVLVRGERAPVVGRVTMDQKMVDVTNIEGAAVGDEVVLLGSQGDYTVSATQIATLTGSIPWEVLCDISARVHRVFTE
jgi:alanine racemase